MEKPSDWFDDIVREISSHEDRFSQKDYKKYKLDLLLRIAKRVASFSSDCEECQVFQREITELAENLGSLPQMPKENHKSYFRTINSITGHLRKDHSLVTEGQNLALWMSVGISIGVSLGLLLGSIALGIPIGMCMGIAVGSALDAKAKKEGRVI